MSLDRTRTRIARPILTPDVSGPIPKTARPFQRFAANLFDIGLLAFLVFNTYQHFDILEILPKFAHRHHYFIVIFYFYFFLTILPHHFFGQSIGQAITGVRVVSVTFKPLPLFKGILRDLLRPTTLFIPFPVFSRKSKAWYDSFLQSNLVDVR